jgi:hypothetical protein
MSPWQAATLDVWRECEAACVCHAPRNPLHAAWTLRDLDCKASRVRRGWRLRRAVLLTFLSDPLLQLLDIPEHLDTSLDALLMVTLLIFTPGLFETAPRFAQLVPGFSIAKLYVRVGPGVRVLIQPMAGQAIASHRSGIIGIAQLKRLICKGLSAEIELFGSLKIGRLPRFWLRCERLKRGCGPMEYDEK